MYILYYLLYAGIGFWSLNKLSKMGETFYSSENSIKIIIKKIQGKTAPFGPPLNPPLLLLNVTALLLCYSAFETSCTILSNFLNLL